MNNKKFACDVADILAKELHIFPEKRAANLCDLFEKASHETFNDFIIGEGLVEKDDLLKALSIYYNVPSFDARGFFFDHHLVTMFPKGDLLRHGFIPLSHDGPTMIIIAADPSNSELPEIIGKYVSYDVTFVVGLRDDISDAIKEYYDLSLTEYDDMSPPVEGFDFEEFDADRMLSGRGEEE